MMKANLPMQIMAVSKLNDPIAVRKRVALSLPEPRVSDMELDEIVKLGAQAQPGAASDSTSGVCAFDATNSQCLHGALSSSSQ